MRCNLSVQLKTKAEVTGDASSHRTTTLKSQRTSEAFCLQKEAADLPLGGGRCWGSAADESNQ
jgi:hypothetical protein